MNEKLKTEVEKYEIREANAKSRKECLGLPMKDIVQNDSEKDKQIEELQKQNEEYKEKIQALEKKVFFLIYLYVIYIYMGNSISFRQILWGHVLELPQISVCCST